MKKRQFTLACILAALMLASCSCGGAASSTTLPETTETDAPQTTEAANARYASEPTLPALDMKGETFTIFSNGWCSYAPLSITDIAPGEENGEPLNDAAYRRAQKISEEYNVKLEHINNEDTNAAYAQLASVIAAGDNEYDIVIMRGHSIANMITSGMLCDLDTVPNLNLDAPYYDQSSLASLALSGKHYAMLSNLTTLSYHSLLCAYFNKQLAEDYSIPDIYETVSDGKWTLDFMLKNGKIHASDVNNDGSYTAEDQYAFTYIVDNRDGLATSSGITFAEISKDGGISLTYNNGKSVEKLITILEKLSDKALSFDVHARSNEVNKDEVGMFMNRQSLFHLSVINHAPQFRDMKDDFGIIPMPKYDEAQADYYTPVTFKPVAVTTIPVTNSRLAETGIIMEAMSYMGYTELYDTFYDTLLKGKIARDAQSQEMLDLVFSSTRLDTGLAFNLGDMLNGVRNLFVNSDTGVTSYFASVQNSIEASVKTLTDAMNEKK